MLLPNKNHYSLFQKENQKFILKVPFNFNTIAENPRHHLLTFTQKLPYSSYLDLGIISFNKNAINEQKDPLGQAYFKWITKTFGHLYSSPTNFFEHAKNKYLLSCDGFGAAWSRIELIMATGSVLFLNAECEQYFYPLMKENETHIKINKYFDNLDTEFQRLENDPVLAERIGLQGKEFAERFFSQEAINTYLRLVLNKLEFN